VAGVCACLDGSPVRSYVPCMGQFLRRYWGYLAIVIAILGWATHTFGYAVILILSGAALIYFLVQAPLTCGAEGREGHCRNNSHGLLMGCWIRQHKWQRLKDVFVSRKWRETGHSLLGSPKDILATVGGLASVVSLLGALIVH
jgi:hypothetical protein